VDKPTAKVVRAAGAAVLIVAVLVGVPILLIVVAGWPLPTSMPDWDHVYWAVRQGDVPAAFFIKLFACIVWLAWAQIAWALLWELIVNVPRGMRGQPDRATPMTPTPASKLARRLVTAAMVLTAISSTPANTAAAPALNSLVSAGGPAGVSSRPAAVVVDTPAPSRPVRPQVETTASRWRVVSGDTLWDIAEHCLGDGSRVDEILKFNWGLDPARPLRAGQLVELPAGVSAPAERASSGGTAPPAAPAAVSGHRYTAVRGDTLSDIINGHYGFVTTPLIEQVAADSGIADPSLIYAGQVIVLRDLAPEPPAAGSVAGVSVDAEAVTTYRVVKGDTLWDILERHYGYVDAELVRAVAAWNGLENPSLIYADQQIRLPTLEQLFPATPAPVDVPVPPPAASTSSVDEAPAWAPVEPAVTETPVVAPADQAPVTSASEPSTSQQADVDDPAAPPAAEPTTVAPTTTTVASAPPSTTAPTVAAARDAVESDDMLSSRWLFGGVAVTSLGLVGAWMTLKQKRRHRRRWLGLEPSAVVATTPTDRERGAQDDVAMLRTLVDPSLLQTQARAVLLGVRPEIWFRDTPPAPPEGWESVEQGWRRTGDAAASLTPVLSPALVTIGHATDDTDDAVTEVLLDLMAAGSVSVTGDSVAVERLVCSMLWELASDPLGGAVDLRVVGLACEAARHASNAGRSVSLDEAIATAQAPLPRSAQVFLVDPYAGDTSTGNIRDLVEACAPASGRAVVVAGPCEHPVEQISVPSAHRVLWDELTLAAPQLPETVDLELGRMLDATDVGRRFTAAATMATTPDPEAEAVALRATLTLDTEGDGSHGDDEGRRGGYDPVNRSEPYSNEPVEVIAPVTVDDPVELPEVVLSVCGREVAVHGYPVPQAPAVLFVLAAAGRDLHTKELSELTGYAAKSLATVFTASHDLVERDNGTLRLASHVWTDHAWATNCVGQLADAMQRDAASADTARWTSAAFEALQALEQAPFAVLPTGRDRRGSPWQWVDDFPADAPARTTAETEIAEAALAFSELWLADSAMHRMVRPDQLVAELSRLAATIPFARVVRQLRDSPWTSGAECLLSAAARLAAGDDVLLGRVQQTARALAAREQLEASNELADELGL
jgi:nucleoid-associated protein YgaU